MDSILTSEARTILGPLATIFSPPASCTIVHGLCSTCSTAWRAQTCVPTTVQDNPSCWPPTTSAAPTGGAFMLGWGFYSPGVVCPTGHYEACSATAGGAQGWQVQYLMEPSETFAGCCPLGFRCHNENGQTCISEAVSTSFATVSCIDGTSNNFGYMTVPQTEHALPKVTIYAPMIQLAWKPTDHLLRSAFATSPTISYITPTSTNVSRASSGLSTGTIAGIAVGVAASVFGLLVTVFFVWRASRSRDRGSHVESQKSLPPGYSESPGYSEPTSPAELKHHTILYTGVAVDQDRPCDAKFSYGPAVTVLAELGCDGPVELPGPEIGPRELMSRDMLMEDEPKQDDVDGDGDGDGEGRGEPEGGLGPTHPEGGPEGSQAEGDLEGSQAENGLGGTKADNVLGETQTDNGLGGNRSRKES
ncbi:hypothetical protein QBC42DRAFT_180680 [Cladorrhinum samala]|uniref:Uncharacterized protein n=1 Tax=Cladorrhinum samala TaxID=585594 RepID=A0AAV9HKG3_9PEZI|nr:hypothetical protein QBC42DRAFT_180680 [Cladorrhinum samala]